MLGIIIGVGAVIGMLAIGNGFRQYLDSQFDQLGIGSFYVFAGSTDRKVSAQQEPQLSAADAQALIDAGAVADGTVAAQLTRSAQVSAGGRQYSYSINGVTPSYFSILPKDLGAGRLYTAAEERESVRVAVLGGEVAKKLFGSPNDGIGQRITINGVGFEVVGCSTPNVVSASAATLARRCLCPTAPRATACSATRFCRRLMSISW